MPAQRRWWEAEYAEVDGENGLNLAGWCKKLTGLPSITVGSVGLSSDFIGSFQGESSKTQPIGLAVERLEKGEFDMIAVGRAPTSGPLLGLKKLKMAVTMNWPTTTQNRWQCSIDLEKPEPHLAGCDTLFSKPLDCFSQINPLWLCTRALSPLLLV